MAEEEKPVKVTIKVENEDNTRFFVFEEVKNFQMDHMMPAYPDLNVDRSVGVITVSMKPQMIEEGYYLRIFDKNLMSPEAWEEAIKDL